MRVEELTSLAQATGVACANAVAHLLSGST